MPSPSVSPVALGHQALLWWRTLRYLRPRQLLAQVAVRARGWNRSPDPDHELVVRAELSAKGFLAPRPSVASRGALGFLNDGHRVAIPPMDWHVPTATKLWRYNLHYFDYLHWPTLEEGERQALLDGWIQDCPPGSPDAWEPYPVSLRTVNWVKYWLTRTTPTPRQLTSLARQLAWLERNVEHHLLANHLLKNGKALFFGGMFLSGPYAERWLGLGLDILLSEAAEQILPDGGHFERSPMYHCIVLEDYLDALNIIRSNPGLVPREAECVLTKTAKRALGFLASIRAGDRRIPLFNDAAFGVAAEPDALLDYGQRILGELPDDRAGTRRIDLPHTGYFGYRDGGESLIVDCGAVGPDYQPGHAHCDTLSYELCVDGERVVVDTGVLDYEVGSARQLVRGTAAHNTVRVDGAEQSEIWGAFRVARRARPVGACLGAWDGERLEFRGAHDGYRRLPGRMLHERRIVVERGRSWSVFDLITGTGAGSHTAESFVHLAPGFSVEPLPGAPPGTPGFLLRQARTGGLQLRLTVTCGSPVRVLPGYTFPEFGLRVANQTLLIERQGVLPLEMHYKIERV